MSTLVTRNPLATPLFHLAAALRMAARRVQTVATRLNVWLEERRAAAGALAALIAMSDRDLRDIGLTRCDVQRLANVSLRSPDWRSSAWSSLV
jgi:uncharacterized protein YjiS (DUF1127 family)